MIVYVANALNMFVQVQITKYMYKTFLYNIFLAVYCCYSHFNNFFCLNTVVDPQSITQLMEVGFLVCKVLSANFQLHCISWLPDLIGENGQTCITRWALGCKPMSMVIRLVARRLQTWSFNGYNEAPHHWWTKDSSELIALL